MEDPEPEHLMMSMSISMSMSFSMSNDDALDCSALQQMWEDDPRSIQGSELMIIKEECDQGLLSTADEVAEAIEIIEAPINPSIDEQFAQMAQDICTNVANVTDPEVDEIQAACKEDPRDDDKVIDAATKLKVKRSIDEGNFFCNNMC